MKKKFNLRNLDCANCAARFETAIAKLEGVQSVSVSFLTQKLTLEAEAEQMEALLEKIIAIGKKVVPECTVLR